MSRTAGRRPGGLWNHPDFRRLWIGETVSQFGGSISQLALPLVAILVVHASTFEVGALAACETLAFLVVGLPAGAWVDRMRYRRVLVVTDLVRAVALGSVPVAAVLGPLSIGQLCVVALVVGTCTVFFDVAYQSYLPQLVDRDALVDGNAKLQASESVAQIAGPSVGGLLVQWLTAPYAVLVDAVSFVWSAIWVNSIHAWAPKPARRPDRHLGREIAEGVRFVFGNRLLRAIAACTSLSNLFMSMSGPLFLLLLARELRLSAGVIGLLSSVVAAGGLIGSVLASRIAARFGQGPTIVASAAASVPMGLLTPFVHRDWTLGLLVAVQLFAWASIVVYNITQVSFRQALAPPELLGRMNATMRFLVWGTIPVGSALGGLLGSAIGVRPTLFVAGAAGVLPVLPVLVSPLRHLRDLPTRTDALSVAQSSSSESC